MLKDIQENLIFFLIFFNTKMAIVLNPVYCGDLLYPISDGGDDLCKNILELPKDILEIIQTLLGKKKYMFLDVEKPSVEQLNLLLMFHLHHIGHIFSNLNQ